MVSSHGKSEDTNMPIGTDSGDKGSEVSDKNDNYIGNSTRGHSCYIVPKEIYILLML